VRAAPNPSFPGVAGFRTKLVVAMMAVVSIVSVSTLLFTQRNLAAAARLDFRREFQAELASLHSIQGLRDEDLAERCRILAGKPRIHAALEDGAPDLLYPSAHDEMQGIMGSEAGAAGSIHALYYRFLDEKGRVVSPADGRTAGLLRPREEAELALPALPDRAQTGYIVRESGAGQETVDEVIAMPIVSSENGETIAAVVVGFRPPALGGSGADAWIQTGVWLGGRLDLPALPEPARGALAGAIARAVASGEGGSDGFEVRAGGTPYLVSFERLNPGSLFPPAYEVSVHPLAEALSRQRQLLWEFVGAGALALLGAFVVSQLLSRRLSEPVEKLAVDSLESREHWRQAEAALELTSQELQRSARFSADASHQLKTPVTVLRAGLEELLAGEELGAEARAEISRLVHQTFRLASVIEDLLLLSRMDAGRLKIQFANLDLSLLLDRVLDDLSALPDPPRLSVDSEIAPSLWISGERRFAELILQNLLENARKYNREGGRIRLAARADGEWAVVSVGNTGAPIPRESQAHIFERFHRGAVGENVPGHGIGLNLARDLARLHGGDLRLSRSDADWTEFELRLRLEAPPGGGTP